MSNPGPYGQDPYGQDPYGRPQYPTEQFPEYGEPHYPTEQYPQYGAAPYPDTGTRQFPQPGGPGGSPGGPGGRDQRPIFIALGAVVLAGIVVIVLAVSGVFSGDSPDDKQAKSDPPAPTDTTSVSTPDPTTSSVPTPSVTSPTLPSISRSLPSLTGGAGLGSFCPSTTSPVTTVRLFVSGITLSSLDLVKGCTYPGSVPTSTLQKLIDSDQLYSSTSASGSGPTFTFTSIDSSSKLTVRTEKKSDGKYYVTAVRQS